MGQPVAHFHRGAVFFPSNYRLVLMSTMPRSGTWYSYRLLEYINSFVMGQESVIPMHGFEVYPLMGMAKLHIHCACPGFLDQYHGEHLQKWEKLKIIHEAFDPNSELLEANKRLFSPASNANVKIDYIYRNPLDQAVSYYFHGKKHKDPKMQKNVAGHPDVRSYLRNGGLDSYIKQFFTFHEMKKKFPKNVNMVKYEDLKRHPDQFLRDFFSFCGIGVDKEKMEQAIKYAVDKASVENVRKFEAARGRSLANDQASSDSSHVRGGGKVAQWKKHLDESDFEYVGSRMAEFGIDVGQSFIFD